MQKIWKSIHFLQSCNIKSQLRHLPRRLEFNSLPACSFPIVILWINLLLLAATSSSMMLEFNSAPTYSQFSNCRTFDHQICGSFIQLFYNLYNQASLSHQLPSWQDKAILYNFFPFNKFTVIRSQGLQTLKFQLNTLPLT